MELSSYVVDIAAEARADIDANFDFMERAYGTKAALDYTIALTDALDTLEDLPERCPSVGPELPAMRRLIHHNHVAYFRIEGREVLVLRVLHMSRDHEAELDAMR